MSLVALGSSGLPVQVTPVIPQTSLPVLVQPQPAQLPTAISKLGSQAGSNGTRFGGDGRRGNTEGFLPRGALLDISA